MTKPRSGNEDDENAAPLPPQSRPSSPSAAAGILGIATVQWPRARAERPRSPEDLVARFDLGHLGDAASSSNASTLSDLLESSSRPLSGGAATAATEHIFRSPECSVVSAHAASRTSSALADSVVADVSLTSSSSGVSSGSHEVLTADDKTTRRRRRGGRRIVAAALVVFLVAVLAVTLGVVLREGGGDDTGGNVAGSLGDPPTNDGADDKTDRPAPTASPTATPATIPPTSSPTPPPSASVAARLREALASATRDPSLLSDPTTPQGMAFDWLSKDPIASTRLRRSLDDGGDRIVQRYALAVLYFSTAPPPLRSSPPSDGRALSERQNGRPRTMISTLRTRRRDDALPSVRKRRTEPRGGTGLGWRDCGAIFNPTKNDKEGKRKDDAESPVSNRISCRYDANEGIVCDDDQSDVAPSNNETEDVDDKEDRYRDDPIWCYDPRRGPNGGDEQELTHRFLSNVDECDWFGIECDNDDEDSTDGSPGGVVTKLRLESNNINGTLPPELLALSHLRTLSLFDNAIRGSIPSDIARSLTQLVDLNLSNNDLSGSLPSSLYGLRDLIVLDLSMNNFTGTVDDDLIPGWTNLATLELYGNRFRGMVPWYSLGSIQSLERVGLQFNEFESDEREIPPSFCDLRNITLGSLAVDCPYATCSCCTHCCDANARVCVPVKSEKAATDVPTAAPTEAPTRVPNIATAAPSIATAAPTDAPTIATAVPTDWPTITTGSPTDAPTEVSVLHQLAAISGSDVVSDTSTPQGKAAHWLLNVDKYPLPDIPGIAQRYILATFYFSTNSEGWTNCGNDHDDGIDSCSYNVEDGNFFNGRRRMIEISAKRFLSPVHECLWAGIECSEREHGDVTKIRLQGNNLRGTLPSELGTLSFLQNIVLGANKLVGKIPTELALLTHLNQFEVRENQLHGRIPKKLYGIASLKRLSLKGNSFGGTIGSEIGNLRELLFLNFAGNDFHGTVPTHIGLLEQLETLNLGDNSLSGTIPSEIGLLRKLRKLIVHKNGLNGSLPIQIEGMEEIEILQIHSNEFSGPFPHQLYKLTKLQYLRAYDNHFSGEVPTSVCEIESLTLLQVDCGQPSTASPPAVACSCCTQCS